jgi:3-methyl-2-oxobutanoate hydroxymethyltransferase
MKGHLTPYVCLTAYTARIAELLDPHVDLILVGDSVGMTQYGFKTTLPVTLDMMLAHGAAVVRATKRALIVVDMPYGTYEESPEQALTNAQRIIAATGCQAVKLEGGAAMAPTVAALTQNGIAVMGHVGLLPQSVEKTGGYKIQGRDAEQAANVRADAQAVAVAGAFAIVIEGTVESVARAMTADIAVPTIGIGASAACDGQILVIDDVLGMTAKPPRFAKAYADLAATIADAAARYAAEVRTGQFPAADHCFGERPAPIAKAG